MKFRASPYKLANIKMKNSENSSQFYQITGSIHFLLSYVFHKILTRLLEDTFCEIAKD